MSLDDFYPHLVQMLLFFVEYAGNNVFKKVIIIEHRHGPV